ncbi:MAG: hypothetical protein AAFY73_12675, partial [Pseudomonadota bacterium]
MSGGLVIAAPSSGSGKTVVTLALLRLLSRLDVDVSPIKLGPDYIDPAFHAAACGRSSVNIDPWAMAPGLQSDLLPDQPWIAEAMMGLYDGAADGTGAAAEFAVAAVRRAQNWGKDSPDWPKLREHLSGLLRRLHQEFDKELTLNLA